MSHVDGPKDSPAALISRLVLEVRGGTEGAALSTAARLLSAVEVLESDPQWFSAMNAVRYACATSPTSGVVTERHAAAFTAANKLLRATGFSDVAKAAVDVTRHALGCDIAYLSLVDPVAEALIVQSASGGVPDFSIGRRQPLNKGLGGLIVASGRVEHTADRRTDPRFELDDDMRAAAVADGSTALIGAPLLRGSDVFGVLVGINRAVTAFDEEDMGVLMALASLVSTSIERADRHRELTEASERLGSDAADLRRLVDFHRLVAGVVLRGGQVDEILQAVRDEIGRDVRIVGERDRKLEFESTPLCGVAEGAAAPRNLVLDGGDFAVTLPQLSEIADVSTDNDNVESIDLSLAEIGALGVGLALQLGDAEFTAETKLRTDLLDTLLSPSTRSLNHMESRLKRGGVDLQAPMWAVAARGARDDQLAIPLPLVRYLREVAGLFTRRDNGDVVMLFHRREGEGPHDVGERISKYFDNGSVTLGLAAGALGLAETREAVRESVHVVDLMIKLGRTGRWGSREDLGLAGVLGGGQDELRGHVERVLGPLLRYDETHGTALVETLDTYFGAARAIAVTGQRLHVHRKTVAQRLHRAAEVLNCEISDPDVELDVRVALQIRQTFERTATTKKSIG